MAFLATQNVELQPVSHNSFASWTCFSVTKAPFILPKMDDQKDNFGASKDSKSYCSNDWENEKSTAIDAEKLLQADEDKGSYTCDICEKRYSFTRTFTRHSDLKKHHTQYHRPLECYICRESFSSLECLQDHERSHTGPFVCYVCGKEFSEAKPLKRHMVIHSSDKPHVCNVCNKAFATKRLLKSHLYIHLKKKPYVCGLCNKGYTEMKNLKRHCDHSCSEASLRSQLKLRPIRPKKALKVHSEGPKKTRKVRRPRPKKVEKPNFWDTLRKGFSKSYLKDQRQAVGEN